jgi:hypothetical protein
MRASPLDDKKDIYGGKKKRIETKKLKRKRK